MDGNSERDRREMVGASTEPFKREVINERSAY